MNYFAPLYIEQFKTFGLSANSNKRGKKSITSPVSEAEVGEPPHIAQTDGIPEQIKTFKSDFRISNSGFFSVLILDSLS